MKRMKHTTQEQLQKSDHEVLVACEVCLTEVPVSGAKSEEASDYVAHFCGLACYDKWRNAQDEES